MTRLPRAVRTAAGQAGLALPMAMLVLLLLASLTMAVGVLARSEPVIASNHLRVAQARAMAESGLERAIWALSNPAAAGGIADPMPSSPAPAPHEGTFVSLGAIGGYQVTVTNTAVAHERGVLSVGWTPSPTDPRTKAHRRIQATVMKFPDMALNAPCALCVRGALQVSGNSNIDARTDTGCGQKYGTYTSSQTCIGTSCTGSSSATIYGSHDSGAQLNQANEASDYREHQDPATFDAFTLKTTDLAALRELAKRQGTYYGPGASAPGWSNGSVTFNSSNRLPNGIIFVDNASGVDITQANAATVPQATVNIHGNAPMDPSGVFQGWIVVNGSLTISGNVELNGLVYALNDLSYTGTGSGRITGLVVTQNTRDTASTSIDTNTGGNAAIEFNCNAARGIGQLPQGWFVQAGTYREIEDP